MVRFKIMNRRKKEDRISLLPDCILLEIISRLELSTKEAIKTTTTISKRWRHLWTRLPTLVFTNEDHATKGNSINVVTNYFAFIDKTLTQCPTDVNLKKLKLQILCGPTTLHVNRWIRYATMRNVQEIDLRITDPSGFAFCDDELFFNNSCLVSMKLSGFRFNPPNGAAIRWDKLKCLCIDRWTLDEDLIGKILSGSPCLETLELNDCDFDDGRIPLSLFGNFGVLEHLSCDLETYERFSCDDELLGDESDELLGDVSETPISMKLSRCAFNPPNGSICMDKLKFMCIDKAELDEYSIGKILSGSPCLETLQLNECCGFMRIDVTSKSVKNLVLSCDYGCSDIGLDILEINAPYILSLTIKGEMCLEEFLLHNVSSLVKADLNYWLSDQYAERDQDDEEEELLQGLLSSLGHVNEIALGGYNCLQALSRLEAKGFQFRKGSDLISCGSFLGSYRIFPLNHE